MAALVGAHLSTQGGLTHALEAAKALNATALAMFVKSQRRWQDKPLASEAIASFKTALVATRLTPSSVLVHSGYLINLASPRKEVLEASKASLVQELERVEQLGLKYLVLHPGSHLNTSLDEGIKAIASGLTAALSAADSKAVILLENSAGQGSSIGSRLEELGAIIEALPAKSARRVAVCLDTCHLWAAGYDFSEDNGCEAIAKEIKQYFGWELVKGLHVNGSIGACGSHRDRHASLGQGSISKAALAKLLALAPLHKVPWVLETPDSTLFASEISWLRQQYGE